MILKNKKVKHLLELTFIYFAISAIALYIIFSNINASIVVDMSSAAATESRQQGSSTLQEVTVPGKIDEAAGVSQKSGVLYTLTGIPANAENLYFSSDGLFCTYCLNGMLYIVDIPSGKIIKKITTKGSITNAVLMYDRNIIIYFTIHSKAVFKDEITVDTYNIDTKQQMVHSSFIVTHGSIIKQVDYSSLTGQVYFNIESGKDDVIYHINIMKKLVKMPVGGSIDSMALTNARQAVYYDKGNTLYYQSKLVKSLKNVKIRILGCDINDNIYVQSQDDKTYVYVIKDAAVLKTIRLDDAGFTKVYSNKTAIYLVYPRYVLNLSADPVKKASYDENFTFKGFIENHLYLSNKVGDIIVMKGNVN